MKSIHLTRPAPVETEPLELVDVPVPEPGPGELLVKVLACGACHTDLHQVEGELEPAKLPVVPGHQIVGVVEKAGDGVTRFRVGDRVGAAWLAWTCGACDYCKRDLENLCENAEFTGYSVDGGYAEYTTVAADFAYPVAEGVSAVEAAPLLCGGIIGYRALRLSGIRPGQRLGMYGFGNSAHVAIQVARHWGCDVYVFSRGERHRKLAEELGAVWTGRPYDDAPSKKLHASVVFAPVGGLVPVALEHLDKGGTVALAGIYMTPIPELDYEKHLYYEKTFRSVANSTRRDGEELLALAAEIPIKTTVETFPLEEANRVLKLMKDGRLEAGAVFEIASEA
jgi:propanol-preferring alcohol dehydrogenase